MRRWQALGSGLVNDWSPKALVRLVFRFLLSFSSLQSLGVLSYLTITVLLNAKDLFCSLLSFNVNSIFTVLFVSFFTNRMNQYI